jgi:hypothetical protein
VVDGLEFNKDYLTVSVGETVLELLPMGDLPAKKVMGMLGAKQNERLDLALDLMKLAAKNPKEFETEAEFMSFNELVTALDVWMDKSSEHASMNRDALIKENRHGFSITVKRRVGEAKRLIDDVVSDLDEDVDMDREMAEGIAKAVLEATQNLGSSADLTEDQIVRAVAMWFVREGREQELINNGMLSEKSKNGKYYPIMDNKVARRLGFSEDEAKGTKDDGNKDD